MSEMKACQACGMPTTADEYHPYAACLMFMGCKSSSVVRANLDAIRRPDPAPVGVMVPDGFALVPVEPSEEMIIDGFEAATDCENDQDQDLQGTCRGAALVATATYQAMVKRASQQNPQPGAVVGDDRRVLEYLMAQFDGERFVCERCGDETPTSTCDSAIYLRQYLTGLPVEQCLDTITNTDKGVASE